MKTVLLPHQRLAMTLRYLAVGECQASLSFSYRCGRATVSKIIYETLAAIVKVLHKSVLSISSTTEEWKTVASEFWNRWNLPHCLGAIDGKHIQIQQPKASGSGEGSLNDGAILSESVFGRKLTSNELNTPDHSTLPGSDQTVDYFFAADNAFQLRTNIMKPFAARKLSMKEAIYNYRLSRGRRVVENAFGILTARWRIFRQPICCSLETADLIVLASVCLHNFIIRSRDIAARQQYCPEKFVDIELSDGNIREGGWRQHVEGEQSAMLALPSSRSKNCSKSATAMRETLAGYLSSVGSVKWQEERICKGFWGAHIRVNESNPNETDRSL